MPSLTGLVLCSHVLTDKTSNNVSFIHVIDQFNLPSAAFVPAGKAPVLRRLPVPVFLVGTVSWVWPEEAEVQSASVSVHTKTAGGAMLRAPGEPLAIEREGFRRTRLTFGLEGLPLDRPGIYEIRVLLDGKLAGSYPFDVNLKNDDKGKVKVVAKRVLSAKPKKIRRVRLHRT
jgi:hypothetical protein